MLNRTFHRDISLVMAMLVTLNSNTFAGKHDHDDHGNLDSHVHGSSTLLIAKEGKQVQLQLESPAANLLGFEHRASTSKEKEHLDHVKALLNSPELLFSIPAKKANSCKIQSIDLDLTPFEAAEIDSHKHEHDHDKHEDHHESSDAHQDITASYEYLCENANDVQSIKMHLMKQFPAIEKLQVMWVSEQGQGSKTLTPGQTELQFNK